MPVRENTKSMFAAALKELLKTRQLKNLRVNDICAWCGAKRQTFYYHFRDKYNLVAWIYWKDLETSVREYSGNLCEEQLACLLNRLDAERAFYRKVFSETAQNSLDDSIYRYNVEKTEELLKQHLEENSINEELLFSIRYHAAAWVACMRQWVVSSSPCPAAELAAAIYRNMPDPLRTTLRGELLLIPKSSKEW